MPACTEEGRDFRNNYYKTLIQTDFYDCTYVYTYCSIILYILYDVHNHSHHLSVTAFHGCI